MAVQPADISAILNAFGQLGQANALRRQRDLQAEAQERAERQNKLATIGALAGGAAGGFAGAGNPAAIGGGAALGSQLGRGLGGGQVDAGAMIGGGASIAQGMQYDQAQKQLAQQRAAERSALGGLAAQLPQQQTIAGDTGFYGAPSMSPSQSAMADILKGAKESASPLQTAAQGVGLQKTIDELGQKERNAKMFYGAMSALGFSGQQRPSGQAPVSPNAPPAAPPSTTPGGAQSSAQPATAMETGQKPPIDTRVVKTPEQRMLMAATMFAINQGDADVAIKYLDAAQKREETASIHKDTLEKDMRAQYKTFVDEYQVSRQAVQSAVRAPDNSVGDTGLIYDVATAFNGKRLSDSDYNNWLRTDAPGMVQNFAAWVAGGHRLNATMRAQLQELAINEHESRSETFSAAKGFYGKLATRKGIDPENVLIDTPHPSKEELQKQAQGIQAGRSEKREPDRQGALRAIQTVKQSGDVLSLTPDQEAALTDKDVRAMTPVQRKAYKDWLSRKVQ